MKRLTSPRVVLALGLACVFAAGVVISAQRATATMATAATQFSECADAGAAQQATFPMDSEERLRFNFIPTETFPRNGLLLKDMTEPQRKLAHALLRSGLSQRGYDTYTAIIQLENILREIEKGGKFEREPGEVLLLDFRHAEPEGHLGLARRRAPHLAPLQCRERHRHRQHADALPARIRRKCARAPRRASGCSALQEDSGARAGDGARCDAAHDRRRSTPWRRTRSSPTNQLDINPLRRTGLKASAMTPAQRDLLMKVIDAYAGLMDDRVAADRLAKIKAAGIENVAFAWAGPVERGQKHYYRVQGPTFLIEFDNTQNDGNHVHSIWRDFKGDFGRDLLREHIKTAAH